MPRDKDAERAYAPHCDSSILHAPGDCTYCDDYPDWQEAREVQRIAFTGRSDQLGSHDVAPCPSTYFRSPGTRDQWYGNVPYQLAPGDARTDPVDVSDISMETHGKSWWDRIADWWHQNKDVITRG